MATFEMHMPEALAKDLWHKLRADDMRDCGNSMVIVEYDDLRRAEDGLRLAESFGDHDRQIYPVRGM